MKNKPSKITTKVIPIDKRILSEKREKTANETKRENPMIISGLFIIIHSNQPGGHLRLRFPRIWKCRCPTDCPPSSPQLVTTL